MPIMKNRKLQDKNVRGKGLCTVLCTFQSTLLSLLLRSVFRKTPQEHLFFAQSTSLDTDLRSQCLPLKAQENGEFSQLSPKTAASSPAPRKTDVGETLAHSLIAYQESAARFMVEIHVGCCKRKASRRARKYRCPGTEQLQGVVTDRSVLTETQVGLCTHRPAGQPAGSKPHLLSTRALTCSAHGPARELCVVVN